MKKQMFYISRKIKTNNIVKQILKRCNPQINENT